MEIYRIDVELEYRNEDDVEFTVRAAGQEAAERAALAYIEDRGEEVAGLTVYGTVEAHDTSMINLDI